MTGVDCLASKKNNSVGAANVPHEYRINSIWMYFGLKHGTFTRMKIIYLVGCVAVSSIVACRNAGDSPTPAPIDTVVVAPVPVFDTLLEQQAIETVFKEFYRRLNTMCRTPDFATLENEDGTAYVGIDDAVHRKRMSELHATGLLDSLFLKQYDALAKRIDNGLRDGSLEYNVGELPPYGQGANPWINAQDHPNAYWLTITTTVQSLTPTKAVLTWSWGEDMHYPAEAIKTKEGWKISRLIGFDTEYFFASAAE